MGKPNQLPSDRELILNYKPRKQFLDFHKRTERWAVMVCHRRAGKTVACVNDLILRALAHKKPWQWFGAFISPTYTQAKDIAWQYLKEYSRPFQAEVPNESELRVNLWNNSLHGAPQGAQIRLYGGDNPDSLRGLGFDYCIFDEFADCPPRLFTEIIRPELTERQGRCTFIGTVKGRENHLWQTYTTAINDPSWYTALLPASQTGLISDRELTSAKRDMGEARFAAEFECDPNAPIVGSYYGELLRQADLEGRITPELDVIEGPVHTAWDLGHGNNMAVWAFQIGDDGLLIHDFIQEGGLYFTDYIREVKARGYTGKAFFPHDIAVHDFESGRLRIQTVVAEGLKPVHVAKHKVEDRIHATQITLPRARFNAVACAKGLEALRNYKVDYDEKLKVSRGSI